LLAKNITWNAIGETFNMLCQDLQKRITGQNKKSVTALLELITCFFKGTIGQRFNPDQYKHSLGILLPILLEDNKESLLALKTLIVSDFLRTDIPLDCLPKLVSTIKTDTIFETLVSNKVFELFIQQKTSEILNLALKEKNFFLIAKLEFKNIKNKKASFIAAQDNTIKTDFIIFLIEKLKTDLALDFFEYALKETSDSKNLLIFAEKITEKYELISSAYSTGVAFIKIIENMKNSIAIKIKDQLLSEKCIWLLQLGQKLQEPKLNESKVRPAFVLFGPEVKSQPKHIGNLQSLLDKLARENMEHTFQRTGEILSDTQNTNSTGYKKRNPNLPTLSDLQIFYNTEFKKYAELASLVVLAEDYLSEKAPAPASATQAKSR
jgi:hypothetical protein